jgi:hypothetical protein
MPSRKQRRRREKLQRHEYEYVVETDEGEEVVESPRELEPEERPERRAERNGKHAAPRSKSAARGPVDRRGRPIPKPSVQRVLKRAAIFMPLFVAFFFIAAPELSVGQKIFQALLLGALFIPASYLADRLIYRMAERRQQAAGRSRR